MTTKAILLIEIRIKKIYNDFLINLIQVVILAIKSSKSLSK